MTEIGCSSFWQSCAAVLNPSLEEPGDLKGKQPMFKVSAADSHFDGSSKLQDVWKPPPENAVKINVDATFIADNGDTAVVAVARNHSGETTFAASMAEIYALSAEDAEASAVLFWVVHRCGSEPLEFHC